MQFKDVIGQQAIKAQLIRSAQNEKVSQAMLFLGAEGVGKLPLALAFAQYLNCENPGADDSCGVCSSCLKSSKIAHPDIFYTYPTVTKGSNTKPTARDFIEEWRKTIIPKPYLTYADWIEVLDNENKQGNITAEECNQIIRQHSLRHFEGKFKIQIIWGGEYLSKEGNKLLKIIEEPPANTIFLIVANSQTSILPTILSRTQIIKFPRLDAGEIANELVNKGLCVEGQAQSVAYLSEGSWLEAVKLSAESESNFFPQFREWLALIAQISRKNSAENSQKLLKWVDEMGGAGRQNQKIFLHYTLFYIRECIAISVGLPSKLSSDEKIVAEKIVTIFNWETLSKMSQIINNLHYQIMRNANAKIGLMSTSMKIKALLQNQAVKV
jgi:DNA polymerase III subunit delta'